MGQVEVGLIKKINTQAGWIDKKYLIIQVARFIKNDYVSYSGIGYLRYNAIELVKPFCGASESQIDEKSHCIETGIDKKILGKWKRN